MEIEAKYAVTGPISPRTLDQLDLAPYTLRPDRDAQHHDILLDTAERAITSSRHALRVRDENGHRTLTLKGPGTVDGGIHQREELEAPLPDGVSDGEMYDYSAWPSAIAAPVARMAGPQPLVPLIETHIHRRTWIVERDGRQVGELALDEGTIEAHGRSEPVHELELELKGAGEEPDLRLLDARLRDRLPLAPEPRSKLERGLALLEAADGRAEPAGQESGEQQAEREPDQPGGGQHERRPMTGQTPLPLAARHAIKRYLIKLRKHEPKVRHGDDPEDVHDMRVAARRIRSALLLLEDAPGFERKPVRKMRRQLRALSRALGAVRDLDVFLQRLDEDERAHAEARAGLAALRAALERRRAAARMKLRRELGSAKLERRLRSVERFATERVDLADELRLVLVRHFAGGAIWRRYEAVLGFECALPGAPTPALHQLRIACKRLRYTIELFEPALGKGTRPILEALVAVQDHLGTLQDTVVALQAVDELRGGDLDNHDDEATGMREERVALAAYATTLALRRDELRIGFTPLWQQISEESFRSALTALIARL